jgi:hypothetical protein
VPQTTPTPYWTTTSFAPFSAKLGVTTGRPLAIASVAGVLFCVVAFLLLLYFFVKTLIWGDPVTGFPATICIILLLGGIQLFCIGILGQYLSKTYLETKRRPIYITKEQK